MKEHPLVSIIIPIYNVEEYLHKCIDSALNQTYPSIEIICVDDGSTDGSPEILKDYVCKDKRIKVISVDNQGVSNARNIGLQYSKGVFIMFVDADDWVDYDTIDVAVNEMMIHHVDIVLWNYIKEYSDLSAPVTVFENDKDYKGESFVELYQQLIGLTGEKLRNPAQCDSISTVWGKLYKASIIKNNNIQFVDIKITGTAEDLLFNAEYFRFCESGLALSGMYSHYRKQNMDSLAWRYKPRLFDQWKELHNRLNKLCSDKDFLVESLSNRTALSFIGLGINEMLSPSSLSKKYDSLKKILSTKEYREALSIIDLTFMPLHWKLFFYCARHRLMFLVLLLLYVMKRITENR